MFRQVFLLCHVVNIVWNGGILISTFYSLFTCLPALFFSHPFDLYFGASGHLILLIVDYIFVLGNFRRSIPTFVISGHELVDPVRTAILLCVVDYETANYSIEMKLKLQGFFFILGFILIGVAPSQFWLPLLMIAFNF